MSGRIDRLRREAENAARDLALAIAEESVEEPAEGSVISFYKRFDSGGTLYHYAAVRSPHGWHLTGRETRTFQWGDLIEFANGAELYLMVSPPRSIPHESPARRARRQGRRARDLPRDYRAPASAFAPDNIPDAWRMMADRLRESMRREWEEQEAREPSFVPELPPERRGRAYPVSHADESTPAVPEVTDEDRARWRRSLDEHNTTDVEHAGWDTAARQPSDPLADLPAAEPWKLPAGPDYPDAEHGGDAIWHERPELSEAWDRLNGEMPPGADVPMGDDIDPETGL